MKLNVAAVVGVGWVGSAVADYLDKNMRVIRHDPPKGWDRTAELPEADVFFVCVPTPFGPNGFEDAYVLDAVAKIPGKKVVVIKSTVLPGTTDKVQALNPQHKVVFNPEFLRERCAYRDFIEPDRQIVGCRKEDAWGAALSVLEILPKAKRPSETCGTRDAELVKYWSNCYLATRVVFANQMHDLAAAVGADYEAVKRMAEADPRIGPGYFDVHTDGYRGYGGTCFPKDMRALVELGERVGAPMDLLRAAEEINNRLRGGAPPSTWAGPRK